MANTIKKVVEVEIDVDSGDVSKLNSELGQTKKETEDASGTLNAMTGGAIAGFKGMVGGVKKAVMGMKSLKVAVMATGIGILVVAFAALMTYFQKTERGAKQLRVITAALGAVIDTVTDVVIGLGESLFNAFENPQKALDKLGEAVKHYFVEFIPNAIENVIKGFGKLGEALMLLLEGELDSAFNTASEGVTKIADGVTDIIPATAILKEVAKGAEELAVEIMKDVEATIDLETAMNSLIVAERALKVERAQANLEVAKARLLTEDLAVSTEKRLKSLKQAVALEIKQSQAELNLEIERLRIMEAQANIAESDEETVNAIFEQRSKLLNLEATALKTQRRLSMEIINFEKEIETTRKAKLKQEEAKQAKEKATKALETKALIAHQANLDKIRLQLMQEGIDKELIISASKYDALYAQAEGNAKLQNEINEKQGEEAAKIQSKYDEKAKQLSDQRISDEAAEAQAKAAIQLQYLDTVGSVINVVKSFAGENKKVQKAAILAESAVGIAKTIIAVKAASAAALATPQAIASSGVAAIPVIAATVAAGAASVAGIIKSTATAMKALGGGGGGGGTSQALGGGGGATGGGAPQFNTVGTSGFNQVAGSIADQNKQPIKAFVVANDVTSQQSLDRNSRNKSSFG